MSGLLAGGWGRPLLAKVGEWVSCAHDKGCVHVGGTVGAHYLSSAVAVASLVFQRLTGFIDGSLSFISQDVGYCLSTCLLHISF